MSKSAASDLVKQKFLELVAQYESDSGNTVKLADSERNQIAALKVILNGNPDSPKT